MPKTTYKRVSHVLTFLKDGTFHQKIVIGEGLVLTEEEWEDVVYKLFGDAKDWVLVNHTFLVSPLPLKAKRK